MFHLVVVKIAFDCALHKPEVAKKFKPLPNCYSAYPRGLDEKSMSSQDCALGEHPLTNTP